MFVLYLELTCGSGLSRFQTRMVSSLEQVRNEPKGMSAFFTPSGYISTPQMQAEWYRNEWVFPTCNKLHNDERVFKSSLVLSSMAFKNSLYIILDNYDLPIINNPRVSCLKLLTDVHRSCLRVSMQNKVNIRKHKIIVV